jgi:hypothetical protein
MKAYFTRDSVCAGDDGDAPHAREIDVPDPFDATTFIRAVVAAATLPSISGGQATWCLSSGVPLVVLAQQWPEPRMLSFIPPKLRDLDIDGETVRLHFSYLTQRDPEVVFDVLRRLRLRAE